MHVCAVVGIWPVCMETFAIPVVVHTCFVMPCDAGIKKRLEAMAGANGKPISVSGTAAAPAKRVGLSNLLTDPQVW